MWLNQFLLGRPGGEYLFDINPNGMTIEEAGVVVVQRNLAGDLKKSTLKVSAPTIKVNSNFLALAQRNQFASLVGVSDTFLSFQTRDDWQQVFDRATVLTLNSVLLQNASSLRLSAVLVGLGFPSIITISNLFVVTTTGGFGGGGFGGGGFGMGGGGNFNAGTVTYNDLTRVVSFTNPLPAPDAQVFVTYTYKGWLVNLDKLQHKAQGGWLDRFTYDFELTGA